MYTFRALLPSDLETIAAFPQNETDLFFMFPKAVYPLTPEQIEEAAKKRLKPTVVLLDDEVVAHANLYDVDADSCWLGNVIVSPNHRGKGVSKYLIEVMQSIAKEQLKVKRLKLVCLNTNTRGLFFYTKSGFKPFDIARIEKPTGELFAGIHRVKDI